MIKIKRVYDKPEEKDGYRILVDRLWPRGVSKDNAKANEWLKDLGPSNELRNWFGHKPELFEQFKTKYKEELKAKLPELERLKTLSGQQPVTLVYGAKDELHNQAVVLKEVIESL